MAHNLREEFVENVCDTEKYRIDKVLLYGMFREVDEMWRLCLKVDNKLVFVRRWEAWDFYLDQIKTKAELHDVSRGYFCDYGKGGPIEEFQDNDLRDFTYLSEDGTVFCGNHEKYSGAFRYHIWSKEVAEQIRERLSARSQEPSRIQA